MDKYIERFYKRYNNKMIKDEGCYLSKEFKTFASYFKRQIINSGSERGIALDTFDVGHYDFHGFFEKNGKYIYFSYSYPRGFSANLDRKDCYFAILYRTAETNKDFIGGMNHFTNVPEFMDCVEKLFLSESW